MEINYTDLSTSQRIDWLNTDPILSDDNIFLILNSSNRLGYIDIVEALCANRNLTKSNIIYMLSLGDSAIIFLIVSTKYWRDLYLDDFINFDNSDIIFELCNYGSFSDEQFRRLISKCDDDCFSLLRKNENLSDKQRKLLMFH